MKKTFININKYDLPIIIKEDDGGFVANCPIWDDCYAQGDTIEEVINEISYVASSLIELYKEENKKIPLEIKDSQEKSKSNININIPVIVAS
ncbi:MAG: type II toxin-antitoxin system HicB family antitoxin [Patescibacteria group bacterium]